MTNLHMGIDVGSTTVKIVVTDDNNKIIFSKYQRHYSDIKKTIADLFLLAKDTLKTAKFTVVITGSGGLLVSKILKLPFVQEVIATKSAVTKLLPETEVVIELGGEDAKILY